MYCIWNDYIDWGVQSPAKRKTLARLGVSDRITAHSNCKAGRVWKTQKGTGAAYSAGEAERSATNLCGRSYSLLQCKVEAELVPMARDLGLGITPWTPLKSGALSGKYTRASGGDQKAIAEQW